MYVNIFIIVSFVHLFETLIMNNLSFGIRAHACVTASHWLFRRCGAGFEELKVGSGNYSHNIIKSEFMDSI